MKRMITSCLMALCLIFAGCTSVEDQAEDFCQRLLTAMQHRDMAGVWRINTAIYEWQQTLDDEQRTRASEVAKKYMQQMDEAMAQIGYEVVDSL